MTQPTGACSSADDESAGTPVPTLPWGYGTRWLTLDEVVAWLRVPPGTIRTMVKRQTIPYRKVGAALRFPEQEIEEWTRPAARSERTNAQRQIPLSPAFSVRRARAASGKAPSLGVTYD